MPGNLSERLRAQAEGPRTEELTIRERFCGPRGAFVELEAQAWTNEDGAQVQAIVRAPSFAGSADEARALIAALTAAVDGAETIAADALARMGSRHGG